MTLQCEWCQKDFERVNKRGPAPRFCSAAHRTRAHEFRRGYAAALEGHEGYVMSVIERLRREGWTIEPPHE